MNKLEMKQAIAEVAATLTNLTEMPHPSLGIDIDGCVDEAPVFFSLLTKSWPGKVFVISFRDDREKAQTVLTKHNIRCDELVLVNSFAAKAQVIRENGIGTFFDDQPEMLQDVTESCQVMLVRNGGNFCFEEKKWLFSNRTGKMV